MIGVLHEHLCTLILIQFCTRGPPAICARTPRCTRAVQHDGEGDREVDHAEYLSEAFAQFGSVPDEQDAEHDRGQPTRPEPPEEDPRLPRTTRADL